MKKEKRWEGLERLVTSSPRPLAFGLGLAAIGWGLWVWLIPSSWERGLIYAPLTQIVPSYMVGIPMVVAGAIGFWASVNGILLTRVAGLSVYVQATIWGAVSVSAISTHPGSTGTPIYLVLALLSALLWWQWHIDRRRGRRALLCP